MSSLVQLEVCLCHAKPKADIPGLEFSGHVNGTQTWFID